MRALSPSEPRISADTAPSRRLTRSPTWSHSTTALAPSLGRARTDYFCRRQDDGVSMPRMHPPMNASAYFTIVQRLTAEPEAPAR